MWPWSGHVFLLHQPCTRRLSWGKHYYMHSQQLLNLCKPSLCPGAPPQALWRTAAGPVFCWLLRPFFHHFLHPCHLSPLHHYKVMPERNRWFLGRNLAPSRLFVITAIVFNLKDFSSHWNHWFVELQQYCWSLQFAYITNQKYVWGGGTTWAISILGRPPAFIKFSETKLLIICFIKIFLPLHSPLVPPPTPFCLHSQAAIQF